jgi:large subunit ribosomal protein LP0
MPSAEKLAKKNAYFNKLVDLCVNTSQALIVCVDHVRSKQMQDIRMALRGKAVVVMGKNTQIRKALQIGAEEHPDAGLDQIRSNIRGNLGFIFATNCSLDDIKDVMLEYRLPAAAKAGQESIADLSIPAGPTGMDPSQTAFFQALNIGTKIVKGQIELTSDFAILKKGEKVSAGAAIMLQKLNIKPFEYGMEAQYVFQDGTVFPSAVLEISDEVLISKFLAGVANMAAFSREIGIPTEAGMPHMFGNAFRNVAALCSSLDFTFKEIEDVKKFIENPDAFIAAAGPATGGGGGGAKEEKKAAVVEEEEEEEVDFDLFG